METGEDIDNDILGPNVSFPKAQRSVDTMTKGHNTSME